MLHYDKLYIEIEYVVLRQKKKKVTVQEEFNMVLTISFQNFNLVPMMLGTREVIPCGSSCVLVWYVENNARDKYRHKEYNSTDPYCIRVQSDAGVSAHTNTLTYIYSYTHTCN